MGLLENQSEADKEQIVSFRKYLPPYIVNDWLKENMIISTLSAKKGLHHVIVYGRTFDSQLEAVLLGHYMLNTATVQMFRADPLNKEIFSVVPRHIDRVRILRASHEELLARQNALEYPLLSSQGEIILLLRSAAGDEAAQKRLFRSNMRLAWKTARKICQSYGRKELFLDLLQEAYIGLMAAVNTFDIRKGTGKSDLRRTNLEGMPLRFSTHATYQILGAISSFLERYGEQIHTPYYIKQFETEVSHIVDFLYDQGKVPTSYLIALELLRSESPRYAEAIEKYGLEISHPKNKLLLRARKRYYYLIDRVTNLHSSVVERFEDDPIIELDGKEQDLDPRLMEVLTKQAQTEQHALDDLTNQQIRATLDRMVEGDPSNGHQPIITPEMWRILYLRFGLETGEALTLDAIGQKLNLTRERIRQIIEQAFDILRQQDDFLQLWRQRIDGLPDSML